MRTIALLLTMLASADPRADVLPAHARKAAPEFPLLSKYKGKVVLLDFWATWCTGCKVEIPWFMEFASKYKRDGLAVVGVAMDQDGWSSVKPFVKEKKMKYRVAIGDEALAKRYGVESLPMTLLIDRDGRIAASHVGVVDRAAFESEIRSVLWYK